jgi:DNA-binding transcriptional ArsR family regulator
MNTDQTEELARRAAVHAALADPARLLITDTLAEGDASPAELGALLGMPSNLLAHHLRVLEYAGIITRRRSEGDHRRSYLRLVPGALGSLGGPPLRTARRVLFVCTANSARSHLAAALWRQASRVPAASAGTRPAAVIDPGAVDAAPPPERPAERLAPPPPQTTCAQPAGHTRAGEGSGASSSAPAGGGWWFYRLQSACVGDRRAARMAGSSPAMAPIASAAPSPPTQAWAGITMGSPLPWA